MIIKERIIVYQNIYIFATSGSSSIDSTMTDLRNTYPDLNIISGKRLNTITKEDIIEWI